MKEEKKIRSKCLLIIHLLKHNEGTKKKKHYERSNNCTLCSIVNVTNSNWQKHKKPAEEMAKASLPKFRKLNPKFINCKKRNKFQLERYYFEVKY